jgi:hypothetical protein
MTGCYFWSLKKASNLVLPPKFMKICTQPPLLYLMIFENNPQVGHTFHLWLIPVKEKNMTDAPYWTVLPSWSIILVSGIKGILTDRRITCKEVHVPHS